MSIAAPRVSYDGRALVHGHGTQDPHFITLHDTESHDAAGIRDLAGIATFWSGVDWGPGAHRGIDKDGLVALYLDDHEIGYHVASHNSGNLGIEQIGFARFTPKVWLARPKQLDAVAHQLAYWCVKYDIPVRLDTEHGISTHAMQSRKHHGDHYDPGTWYPLKRVLRRTNEIIAEGITPPKKPQHYHEDPYWLWLRWRLGEGEFKAFEPHDPYARPKRLPAKVPQSWWARQEKFLAKRRKAATEQAKRASV